jgi:predicted metal-dependent hydrolase
MKFCPYRRHFIITTPLKVKERDVANFLKTNQDWMGYQLQKHQKPSPLKMGDTLAIFGDEYRVSHDPLRKKGVFETEGFLWVGGKNAELSLEELLVPWFKKRAHGFFADLAQEYASILRATFQRVSVKDTISRWGSCSSAGTLSFNWRLILAPPVIAEYVCAHEVSHLLEMNHSDKFWSLVEQLCPSYKIHRLWLKRYGGALYKQFPLRTE